MKNLKCLILLNKDSQIEKFELEKLKDFLVDMDLQYSVDVELDVNLENIHLDKYKVILSEEGNSTIENKIVYLIPSIQKYINDDLVGLVRLLNEVKKELYGVYSIELVDSISKLKLVLKEFINTKEIFFDLETSILEAYKDCGEDEKYIICISWSNIRVPEKVYVVYLKHDQSPFLNQLEKVYNMFRIIFADPTKKIVAHNINFDKSWVEEIFGYEITAKCECTILQHHLLDITEKHNLEHLSKKYLGLEDFKGELSREINRLKALKLIKASMSGYDKVPIDVLTRYAAADTYAGSVFYNLFEDRLKIVSLDGLYEKYSVPGSKMLFDIRKEGLNTDNNMVAFLNKVSGEYIDIIEKSVLKFSELGDFDLILMKVSKVNKDNLKGFCNNKGIWADAEANLSKDALYISLDSVTGDKISLRKNYKDREKEMKELVGTICIFYFRPPYSLSSPKQVSDILYYKFDFPVLKRTEKGVPSTDIETMEMLNKKFEDGSLENMISDNAKMFLRMLNKHRTFSRTRSNNLTDFVNLRGKDGKIHGNIVLTGTRTGRPSSNSPNLQNIPSEEDHITFNAGVKACIVPHKKGNILINVDFSGIELRVVAALAKEEKMKQAFIDGVDIHQAMAAVIFNLPVDQVTKELRKKSKVVNFGILYGTHEKTLADKMGISKEEVRKIFNALFKNYPKLKEYINNLQEEVCRTGKVKNVFGMELNFLTTEQLERIGYTNKFTTYDPKINAVLREVVNYTIQGPAGILNLMSMIEMHEEFKKLPYDAKLRLQVHDSVLIESEKNEVEELIENIIRPIMCKDRKWMNGVPLEIDCEVGNSYGCMIGYEEFKKHPNNINVKLLEYLKYHKNVENFKKEIFSVK